jgi:RNA polymerase sigma factor (sigma-70 family)
MEEHRFLERRFEAHRSHLRAVAYRMLGSAVEADDAVQEAWLRFSRSDTESVDNLGGWLTTVVARICLDELRARKSRREAPAGEDQPEPTAGDEDPAFVSDPEREILLADSIGAALLVVLEALAPAERVAFVLHDMFDFSFDEIAPILGRSEVATRQLASRARRRVKGSQATTTPDRELRRTVIEAFRAASRGGDLQALIAVLAPDVVVRADAAGVRMGADAELRGAQAVAQTFRGRAQGAKPALVDGAFGLVWAPGGRARVAFDFTIANGKVAAIDLIADPDRLRQLDLVILGD